MKPDRAASKTVRIRSATEADADGFHSTMELAKQDVPADNEASLFNAITAARTACAQNG